jgi:hypothetical protein
MNDETVDIKAIGGLLARHALTVAGGGLVAKGVISASMLEPTVGAVLTLGGVLWSYIQKKRALKS